MRHLVIDGKWQIVENLKEFLWIIEEKLGRDAADTLRDIVGDEIDEIDESYITPIESVIPILNAALLNRDLDAYKAIEDSISILEDTIYE